MLVLLGLVTAAFVYLWFARSIFERLTSGACREEQMRAFRWRWARWTIHADE